MSEQIPPSLDGMSEAKRRLFELMMKQKQAPKIIAPQGLVTGDVPVTPPQAHEFEIHNPDRHIFNLPLLLDVHVPLDVAALEQIVRVLLAHHDALRLCSAHDERGWRQWIAPPPETAPVSVFDLSNLADPAEQRAALEAHVATLQQSFDLARGPLFKAVFFDLGPGAPPRLLLLAHHVACDQHSAGILAEDFVTAYRQLASGAPIKLPAKTSSYQDWAQRLAQHARSEAALQELPRWLDQPWSAARPIPADFPGGLNIGAASAVVVRTIDISGCAQLAYQPLKTRDAQLHDVLVYAVARALNQWTGAEAALISMCQHGRIHPFNDLDVSRTVGWFSYQYPLLIDLRSASAAPDQLRRTAATVDGVPHQGLSYGALRYMGAPEIAEQLRALPEPDLFLNIRVGTSMEIPGFAPAAEQTGASASRTIIRPRYLYLNVDVNDKQIGFQCLYNTNIHRAATVETFIENAITQIYALDDALAASSRQGTA